MATQAATMTTKKMIRLPKPMDSSTGWPAHNNAAMPATVTIARPKLRGVVVSSSRNSAGYRYYAHYMVGDANGYNVDYGAPGIKAPPFSTTWGRTPKNRGSHSTRSASLPTSTEPTSPSRPWATAGQIVYLAT